MTHYRCLMILVCLALFVVTSCGRDGNTYDDHFERLIEKEFSEARVVEEIMSNDSNVIILDELEVDFTKITKPDGMRFEGFKYEFTENGLDILPENNDPIIFFDNSRIKCNMIEVELKSEGPGNIEVFWSEDGSPFDAKRRKRTIIRKSNNFKRYKLELMNELPPLLGGYKFRIDPIDVETKVTLKSITFKRIAFDVQGALNADIATTGKIKIGGETREAFAMQSGREIEATVMITENSFLSFGLAKFGPNSADCLFQVYLKPAGGEKDLVFEKKLISADDTSWSDYKLPLRKYAGESCKIVLAMKSLGDEKTNLIFCSNPTIFSPKRKRIKPNVILVSLDTVGARHLSMYGGKETTDKFMKGLGNQGVVFENAFANSSLTHVSHGSMLTGIAPLNLNFLWFGGDMGKTTTLAQVLRENGYATAAFTGGVLVTNKLGFDRGFEVFYQEDTLYKPGGTATDIEILTNKALEWVENSYASPFFLFLHSYEPHSPFYIKEDFFKHEASNNLPSKDEEFVTFVHMRGKNGIDLSELGDYVILGYADDEEKKNVGLDDIKYIEKRYHSEISFVDNQLSRFFAALRKKGMLDNSIVIITADHGEAFFEHALLEHGLLYDENLRVPLIFWGPGLIPPSVSVEQQVSSIDIVPTILDLLRIESPTSIDGHTLKPLFSGKNSDVNYGFYSFVPNNGFSWQTDNRYKYILRTALGKENFGKAEFFDLGKDPLEKNNLLDTMGKLPDSMARFVADTIESLPGVHISFSSFADSEYEMKFVGTAKFHVANMGADAILGFDIEKIEDKVATLPNDFLSQVLFSESSKMVIINHDEATMSDITISLKPLNSSEEFVFTILADEIEAQEKQINAHGTEKALRVRRVKPEYAIAQRELSPEDEEKLRSLGYIQ